MSTSPLLTILSFIILLTASFLNAQLFIKYELEGVKSERMHIFTAIFSVIALIGALIILGVLISYIA